jgi:alkylation response protein AidB-like acyl-CoA dehydrogenase
MFPAARCLARLGMASRLPCRPWIAVGSESQQARSALLRLASIAKLFATEAAMKAASQAVLMHGNRGYSNEYPVERHYRDIKGLQIYEGTSHIQRLIIARELVGRDH